MNMYVSTFQFMDDGVKFWTFRRKILPGTGQYYYCTRENGPTGWSLFYPYFSNRAALEISRRNIKLLGQIQQTAAYLYTQNIQVVQCTHMHAHAYSTEKANRCQGALRCTYMHICTCVHYRILKELTAAWQLYIPCTYLYNTDKTYKSVGCTV